MKKKTISQPKLEGSYLPQPCNPQISHLASHSRKAGLEDKRRLKIESTPEGWLTKLIVSGGNMS